MTTTQRRTIITVSVAVVLLIGGTAGATTASLMVPAAAFSADGTNQEAYVNYGYYLSTGTTLRFHAWVRLPNAATIVNVDMMTRDDDAGTITGYLKRTRFGVDNGTETLLTFTSPGNIGCSTSGLCHDMESLLEIKVDAANFGYWFEVVVPDAGGTPENDLEFFAVRVMYEYDDLIFADTFESGGTGMWSSEAGAKAGAILAEPPRTPEPVDQAEPTDAELLARFAPGLYLEDPLAQEALENAVLGKAGYGSPYVIPGPAFKTGGWVDFDSYYLDEAFGFVYGRPGDDNGTWLYAPVNLPDGAEISYFFAFYVDSVRTGTTDDIRFWLTRMDTTDIFPTDTMVFESTSGRDTAIKSITVNDTDIEAAVPGSTTIVNSKYMYWVAINPGPYDTSPPAPYEDEYWWHKVYAIVFLYTMP